MKASCEPISLTCLRLAQLRMSATEYLYTDHIWAILPEQNGILHFRPIVEEEILT